MSGASVNFCGLSQEQADYKHASVVILPVPFDKTSTWLKGADKGPAAIIEASQYLEFYDRETDSEVYRKGIFTATAIRAATTQLLIRKTSERISRYLGDHKLVVTLGGEHTVSIGAIEAYAGLYRNLSILHLDAHADSRDIYQGDRNNHACVIARAREYTSNIVSVGIRSLDASELPNVDKKKMFFAQDIHGSDRWIKDAVHQLTDTVYITLDLDVFDPGIMPSTGTPEPGGLSWYRVLGLLSAVAKSKQIVGFDIVELCPGNNKAPDFFAAKLIYTLLSYVYAK